MVDLTEIRKAKPRETLEAYRSATLVHIVVNHTEKQSQSTWKASIDFGIYPLISTYMSALEHRNMHRYIYTSKI